MILDNYDRFTFYNRDHVFIKVKVPMKRNVLFFHLKEHKKLERFQFTNP